MIATCGKEEKEDSRQKKETIANENREVGGEIATIWQKKSTAKTGIGFWDFAREFDKQTRGQKISM